MNNSLLLSLARISLTTSAVIAALLLLTPLLRRRYAARWRYAAWLVITLRLLVPVSFSLPQAPVQITVPERAIAEISPEPPAYSGEPVTIENILPGEATAEIPPQPSADGAQQAAPLTPVAVLQAVWLAGSVLFLLFQLAVYQVFLYRLRRGSCSRPPLAVQEQLWQLGVQMGVCRLPQLWVTSQVDAPVLIGVFQPRLLLPQTRFSGEDMEFILRHELVHYRRRDMWYKLALMLANALHWYNPLVHLMVRQAAKDIELSCDDAVVRELDREARGRYGNAIIATLPRKRRLEPVFSTHFGSTKKTIKGRLRNLFDPTAKRRGIGALCAVSVLVFALAGTVTFGVAAAAQSASAHEPGSQPEVQEATGGEVIRISIASIAPDEVVQVGKIQLDPQTVYTGTLSADSGSGIRVGLHTSPDLHRYSGEGWSQSFGSSDGRTIQQFAFSSKETATYYVYVGSSDRALTGVTGQITAQNEAASGGKTTGAPPLPGLMIHASGSGWAAASSIEERTYQEQLTAEIAWLQEIYDEHKSSFVVTETIPQSQMLDPSGIQHLYTNSAIYREMSRMKNGAFQVEDGESFSRFGAAYESGMVQRTAVMVESSGALILDIDHTLDEGVMSVLLLDPSGQVVFQSSPAAAYKTSYLGTRTASAQTGLWSVVTATDSEDGRCSGSVSIGLRLADAAPRQTAAVASNMSAVPTSAVGGQDLTVQGLGAQTLSAGDTVEADIRWTGGGSAMLLITPEAYSDQELRELFDAAILPGVTDTGIVDTGDKYKGRTFNFSMGASPLQWSSTAATQNGNYSFYLIRFGDAGLPTGKVTVGRANGQQDVIWNFVHVSTAGSSLKATEVDAAAYLSMAQNHVWAMVEHMLPFMTEDGIDAVVRLNNQLNPGGQKRASDYYGLAGTQADADAQCLQLMQKSGNWEYTSPLFPFMSNEGIDRVIALFNQKHGSGQTVRAADYYN